MWCTTLNRVGKSQRGVRIRYHALVVDWGCGRNRRGVIEMLLNRCSGCGYLIPVSMIAAGICPFCRFDDYVATLLKMGYERWAIEMYVEEIREERLRLG